MLNAARFDAIRSALISAKRDAPDEAVYSYLTQALDRLGLAEDAWLWTQRAPTEGEMARMWEAECARYDGVQL